MNYIVGGRNLQMLRICPSPVGNEILQANTLVHDERNTSNLSSA